ncbi:MAG: PepSY-associated TM helix domain-containing protein [Cellvibrionaceae bacterium]
MSTRKRDQLKKFYVLHSWVGVITGILLFVIAFTGAMSVFARPDLKLWANESLHAPSNVTPEVVEKMLNDATTKVDPSFLFEVHAFLPSPRVWTNLVLILEQDHHDKPDAEALWLEYHPQTLELLKQWQGDPHDLFEQRSTDMSDFISGFHADLHLGQLGLVLTGLLGLTLMASIATGLFIHRKILKELFSFRPDRSFRLLLTDTHKVISVWGILFHAMIGFTGAFLGLATVLLVPAAAFVSFEGDQERLLETFSPEIQPALSGVAAPMPVKQVLDDAFAKQGAHPLRLSVYGWGDKNAVGFVDVINDTKMPRETHSYSMKDAQPQEIGTSFSRVGGVSGSILDVIFPLHFGNFGGVAVKIIWALLGISTSLIALTGMMIWVERRAYGSEGSLSKTNYLRLSRLSVGSCAGLVLACSGLFGLQRLAPTQVASGFFYLWALATLWALLRDNEYQSGRQLLGLSGVLLLLLPLLDSFTLTQTLLNHSVFSHFSVITASLVAIGAALCVVAKKLPSARPGNPNTTPAHSAQSKTTARDSASKSSLLETEVSS